MQLVHKRHHVGDREVVMVSDASLDDRVSRFLRRNWRPTDHATVASQLLTNDDFLLDLGANYGMFCIPVVIQSGARCLAVEALQPNAMVLHAAIEANELGDRIDWVLAAVTVQSGEVRIAGSSAFGTVGSTGRRVLSYSLDDLMDELALPAVSMVKMDIEGCELPALRGAARFLDANPDATFIFEANAAHCLRTGSRPQDLVGVFEQRGYLVYLCRDGRLVRRTASDFQEFGNSDYVASKAPLEGRLRGFSFDEFDAATRVAATVTTLTAMNPGYRRATLRQLTLAPPFIQEAPEVVAAANSLPGGP